MTENKPLKYNRWEIAALILPIASLLISCIWITSKRAFWGDELASYYFLSDPSFSHMLTAFHDKINNTPILYFFIGWFWDKIFGSSELSYRLFSSVAFCIALVTIWTTLRRRYTFWPTTIGTVSVFCTSSVILYQNSEARMYGLFLAVCALAFHLYNKLYTKQKPSFKTLVLNTGIHAAIVHTHLFGPFYSAGILLALILSDRYLKVWRPKIYSSIILGALTVILYIPSFLVQADAGKPRTWLPLPTSKDLVDFYNLIAFVNPTIFAFLIFIAALHFICKQHYENEARLPEQESFVTSRNVPILLFACVFFILPVFVWMFSRTIKPVFWERYMIPSALGVIILLTDVTSRLISTPFTGKTLKKGKVDKAVRFLMMPAGLIVLTVYVIWQPITYAKYSEERKRVFENPAGLPDLPIVMQNADEFIEHNFYSPWRNKCYFILDWEAAVNKHSGLWGPQKYKHFDAWRRSYPDRFKNHILTTEEFLAKYDRFIVTSYCADTVKCPQSPRGLDAARTWVGTVDCPQWVAMRLLNNPAYKLTYLSQGAAVFYGSVSYMLVEKQGSKN